MTAWLDMAGQDIERISAPGPGKGPGALLQTAKAQRGAGGTAGAHMEGVWTDTSFVK